MARELALGALVGALLGNENDPPLTSIKQVLSGIVELKNSVFESASAPTKSSTHVQLLLWMLERTIVLVTSSAALDSSSGSSARLQREHEDGDAAEGDEAPSSVAASGRGDAACPGEVQSALHSLDAGILSLVADGRRGPSLTDEEAHNVARSATSVAQTLLSLQPLPHWSGAAILGALASLRRLQLGAPDAAAAAPVPGLLELGRPDDGDEARSRLIRALQLLRQPEGCSSPSVHARAVLGVLQLLSSHVVTTAIVAVADPAQSQQLRLGEEHPGSLDAPEPAVPSSSSSASAVAAHRSASSAATAAQCMRIWGEVWHSADFLGGRQPQQLQSAAAAAPHPEQGGGDANPQARLDASYVLLGVCDPATGLPAILRVVATHLDTASPTGGAAVALVVEAKHAVERAAVALSAEEGD